ncbi:winged helix-turn-helix domain-containing protein [Leucobacter luti]|uniref:Transcriptional regulator n=1 Tax=Leucobacter luti TaxID=340320 RepID=A0A4R6RWQ8_9MICO|nr:winged helix-turn-helix domain-containing protein [Leucobacter luti]MCW2289591.1 DNA-binding winged helix-turn-helix (wHTH) protein [Leucobacter luti]QYM74664.1 winged helix-turn-helix domain-containing protein [Leucobacter luti]TCK37763.1 transcriptional regulator [Leucobacter luti]TDP90755.1 transcriptional regulator [Leucobacter luti]
MTTTQTLRAARPDLTAILPSQPTPERNVPEGTEVRGFALYVGLADDKIADGDPRLGAIVTQIKQLVAQLAPAAETYAAVALAPEETGGRDVDVVRLALGDPAAHARQKQHEADDQDRAASGVVLDLSRKRVLLDNVAAALTFREFELLQYLVLREGRTVSRDELITALWHDASDEDTPSERTIDVHIRRLRVKLAQYQDIVRTVRGTGYRFDRHADVSILHTSGPSPDVF